MNIAVIGSGQRAVAEAAALISAGHSVKLLKTGEIDAKIISECTAYGVSDVEECITCDEEVALTKSTELVFISSLVTYDTELNMHDTYEVDMYLSKVMKYSHDAVIVLRSDVPTGYTKRLINKYPGTTIMYVPDFGRDGRALEDAFNPARLIISGGDKATQEMIYEVLDGKCPVVYTDTDEAESVKLFANVYLAMRVAYFNELDTYAELRGLNAKDIIQSVSLDPRIGDLYNNPSFGYGGRYLVEGTNKLKNDFADIPERIVDMVEISNEVRKDHIVDTVMSKEPKVCGIYGLGMKTGSKDFRYSAVDGVIRRLQARGVRVVIFEPMLEIERFLSADVINDFDEFCELCDVIVANRVDEKVKAHSDKLYTRDIFERD